MRESLLFPAAMVGIGAALVLTISAADKAHEAQAAVIATSVTATTEAAPPDAIWASPETYAPEQDIPMVEPVPETEAINPEDLYLMAHLLAGECHTYSRECQLYTGSVVLNRVAHKSYPNSIEGVIYQPRQYACVKDGNFDREPTATNWEVAEELLRTGSVLPANVIFQSQFKQGDFTYAKVDGEYFCGIEVKR